MTARARRARTTRIVRDPASPLPITADGELYRIGRAYTLHGQPVSVSYVHQPGGKDAGRGTEWAAVVRTPAGAPLPSCPTTALSPLD